MLELLTYAGLYVAKLLNSLLPASPFTQMLDMVEQYLDSFSVGLGMLNWLIDVNGILMILLIWLTAISAYYAYVFGVGIFDRFHDSITKIFTVFRGNSGN